MKNYEVKITVDGKDAGSRYERAESKVSAERKAKSRVLGEAGYAGKNVKARIYREIKD